MGQRKSTGGEKNFEASLKKLEEIVKCLEEEEVPLETSLKLFADGQALARRCEQQLRQAENRVRVLMESDSGEIREKETDEADEADGAAETAQPVADNDQGQDENTSQTQTPPQPTEVNKDNLPF